MNQDKFVTIIAGVIFSSLALLIVALVIYAILWLFGVM